MSSTFDRIVDRTDTDSIKFDFADAHGIPRDALPLWVADMDFPAPPAVRDAMVARSEHGVFGYSEPLEDYIAALRGWFRNRHNWEIDPRWLVKTPGVVYAVATAIRAFSSPGDGVLIQQPVYYPFADLIERNNRTMVVNELRYTDGRYTVDLDDFETKISSGTVSLFILCSPHNPVGRVWTEEELTAMGEICLRNDVVVLADEIHMDFTYPGRRHRVFADISDAFRRKSVTFTAPSKTFNLAGLQVSNVFIPDDALRNAFSGEMAAAGYGVLNAMGIVACRAAYASGAPWLDELLAYLKGNLDFLRTFLEDRIPTVKLVEPDGTYLAWLDFRAMGLDPAELDDLIVHKARLWLDGGTMFGAGGDGFQRVNIATPRPTLARALEQLAGALTP